MKKILLLAMMLAPAIYSIAQKNCPVERMFDAIAQVESKNCEDAVNGNCVGILQISPVMVAEANRLLGYEAFYLNDRWDEQGSYAIFAVIMRHKNPGNDLRTACRIWNPTAGDWYYERVKEAYKNHKNK